MAIFNPQIQPTNDPNYIGWSKPVETVAVDKSLGTLLSGAGDLLEGGVKAGDNVMKSVIDNDVHQRINAVRDSYTTDLNTTRTAQVQGEPLNILPGQTDQSNPVPVGVENGIAQAGKLQGALSGNKISETMYYGRLDAIAKNLRAQYPGYVDYIDSKISTITGGTPANEYIRSIIQDINRASTNTKTEHDKTATAIRSEIERGNQAAVPVYSAFQAGKASVDEVNAFIADSNALKYRIERNELIRKNATGERADQRTDAVSELSDTASRIVAKNWGGIAIGAGAGTTQKLTAFVEAHAGKSDIPDETYFSVGQQMRAARDVTFREAMVEANKGGKNSLVARLGGDPAKAAEVINGQLASWDLAISAVADKKDLAAGMSHMQYNKAIIEDTKHQFFNSPQEEVAQYNRNAAVINQLSPQYAKDFFKDALTGGIAPQYREFVQKQKMNILGQPLSETGRVNTVSGVIDDIASKGITSPKVYNDVVDFVAKDIVNPKVEDRLKTNVIKSLIDPGNQGLIDKFEKDGVDQNGRPTPGKNSVFLKLTNPEVTKEIFRLGQKDPAMWSQYKAWAGKEWGEQLFSRELHDLNDVIATGNFGVSWDNTNQRFGLTNRDGTPATSVLANSYFGVVQSLNRINSSLGNLRAIGKAEGASDAAISANLLNTMREYGYDPEGSQMKLRAEQMAGSESNIRWFVPRQMWDAIIASRAKPILKGLQERKDPNVPDVPVSQ